ncbi:hypothetical protein BJX96DRAFT_139462 [Aspergillus floccosus]
MVFSSSHQSSSLLHPLPPPYSDVSPPPTDLDTPDYLYGISLRPWTIFRLVGSPHTNGPDSLAELPNAVRRIYHTGLGLEVRVVRIPLPLLLASCILFSIADVDDHNPCWPSSPFNYLLSIPWREKKVPLPSTRNQSTLPFPVNLPSQLAAPPDYHPYHPSGFPALFCMISFICTARVVRSASFHLLSPPNPYRALACQARTS